MCTDRSHADATTVFLAVGGALLVTAAVGAVVVFGSIDFSHVLH
jgi:hypothetical protein